MFAYFSDPYGFMRTIVLSLADIALRAPGGPPPAPQRRPRTSSEAACTR